MHPLKIVTASLMLAAMPVLAHADDMSYRYIQLGYMSTDLDTSDLGLTGNSSENGDGFASRGSIGFAHNFFVFTEYSNQDVNFRVDDGAGGTIPVKVSIDQVSVGLGGHYGLSDNLDLVGRAGYTKLNADVTAGGFSGSADNSGYLAAAGLRGRMGDRFELEGGVIYQDLGNNGGQDTGGELLARYYFTKRWALAAEYQDLGQVSSYIVGVRASF